MKILLSADFHGDFTRLFQLVRGVDLCICCGDIFDYHRLPRENFAFPLPFFSKV
ncbi:MAG: metallophosphoesterase [Candidatus Hodarchaeales archaeon]